MEGKAHRLIGSQIIFVADVLQHKLPIGKCGFIVRYEPNMHDIYKYLVRVPEEDLDMWVTAYDIQLTGKHISEPYTVKDFDQHFDTFIQSISSAKETS